VSESVSVSFNAETYRVLIASPSDLSEERQVATDAINEWNSLHSAIESVVLLPVKWETHATPQTGLRPQDAINIQLVNSSDILVGMFWTKIGTSTGVAESGTVEEIDQFVAAAKPAMLYFSRRPIDPNAIDLKQHKRLRSFKAATYKNALIGSFAGLDDLRQTLLRDLLREVRKLKPTRGRRANRLDEAQKLTELIRLHRQHKITPEQFDSYRVLLGLKGHSAKRASDDSNAFVGLFFDYGAVVSASINKDKPNEGWACTVDIAGDNYETKKFEAIGIVVNLQFDTAEAAIEHGKNIVDSLGVQCLDTRTEEL
jgi:hypothetical protein